MKGTMEGLTTLNQTLLRGLPSYCKVFGGRAHFSTSLPLLDFIKNVYLMNPSLDPAYDRGGVHALDEPPGHGRGVDPCGGRHLTPGTETRRQAGLCGLLADRRTSLPRSHPIRRRVTLRFGHLCLCGVAHLIYARATHSISCGTPPSHLETGGAPHRGAGDDHIP